MKDNIFIIEDDISLAQAMQAQFNLIGFNAEINRGNEEDVEAAVNEIRKADADIVILDLILPKLDGFEIIKAIRADEEISDIYIFIFTDVSDEDSKARGLRMGANQYFIKEDFSPEEFAEKVKKIMANREAMEGEDNTYQV
ncbi:MAG TPA: response regulator [Candidatus Methylomirabilis sp.]|nr:response regulator [Candidatus Methylomirabilis sp.]